ncbi:unnamed protein product [Caenorhabditis auriculariae]|uniref:Uncharacterized protein n=1 Tax=Caenorhabditis auriculariae TaxID=2777116 RepID=A0A8S1HI87_9PELO|nr:unnamed protein product [Caenorhabditis auriculariae]
MPSAPSSSAATSTSSIGRQKREKRRGCWRFFCAAVLLAVGLLLLLTGLIMHLAVVPTVVENSIIDNSRLLSGSLLMDKWKNPAYKMKFKLFVYSMKNPDEFMAGAIPEVSGSGPYTFDKTMQNHVISTGNGTVKYRRFATFHFNERESCQTCILGNRIWVPNMIYQKFVEAASTEGMRAAGTTLLSQTAFLEVEVDELLFEGYKDPFLDKICEIPFMNFVCEAILDVPDRIGLFYEANNTDSKVIEIADGTADVNDLGKILSYNNEKLLDETWWNTEESRKIRGTDGSLFKPFIQKTDKLYVFVIELCRSIWLEFKEEIEFKGLKAYRFIMPPEVLDPSFEGNEGFCNPTEKRFFDSQNETECWPKGLLEISHCQRSQAPIMISMPNFLFADDEVKKTVKGMNESDLERDGITVDIEPRLGTVLRACRRSQVNIEMWKGKDLTFPINLKKMKSSLIPTVVVHEDIEIDDESLEQIQSQLYDAEWYAYTSATFISVFGALVFIVGAIFLAYLLGAFSKCFGGRPRKHQVSPQRLPPYVPKNGAPLGQTNGNAFHHLYL